jgi:hypothetical protein
LALIATLERYFLVVRENLVTRCNEDVPSGVTGELDPLRQAGLTAWPLGRSCSWEATGGGTIVTDSGWSVTAWAIVALILVAATSLWRMRSARSWIQRMVSALPLIVTVVVLGMLFVFALTFPDYQRGY